MNGAVMPLHSAAAIWYLADIAYIAIYRDIVSRYFLTIFIEQLFINNHTTFMQVEVALLGWRHKNAIRRGSGGGGGGGTLYIGTYTGIHVHE